MKIKVLDGWARKVGLGAIAASLIGWLIFVVCFGSFNDGDNFYNDISERGVVRVRGPLAMLLRAGMLIGPNDTDASLEVLLELRGEDVDVEKIIDEDFPEDRQDPDFFSFYFFAGAYPIAALLTIAHLILHGIPILGFILSLAAHFLLTLSFAAGAGVFWADGNRLFSEDNNFRNVYGSALVPEDWKSDPYWGSWLVGEWVGVLLTGIFAITYYTITPFFTNTGRLFTRSDDAYEMQSKEGL